MSYLVALGYEGRSFRSSIEQEGLGSRYQGCPVQAASQDIEKAKRRGGREGEAVQLRAGGECEESQGADNGGCGGRMRFLSEAILTIF